jgi:acyl-CoA thioesterase I
MRLTVAGLTLLLACGREKTPSVQTTSVRSDTLAKRTVLMVGTSLTAGLGLDPDQAWPALIQEKIDSAGLPYRVVNAGLSGETSAGALRRVDWLLRGPVDVLVLETGANDGLRGLDPDTLRANLEAILAKVHAERPAAKLALIQMEAPPNLGAEYTKRFHAVYAEAARAERATLLPFLLDSVAGRPTLNQADGMHPNVAGSRIAARTEWRAIEPLLLR